MRRRMGAGAGLGGQHGVNRGPSEGLNRPIRNGPRRAGAAVTKWREIGGGGGRLRARSGLNRAGMFPHCSPTHPIALQASSQPSAIGHRPCCGIDYGPPKVHAAPHRAARHSTAHLTTPHSTGLGIFPSTVLSCPLPVTPRPVQR